MKIGALVLNVWFGLINVAQEAIDRAHREREEAVQKRELELEERQRKLDQEKKALEEAKQNPTSGAHIRFEDLDLTEEIGKGGFGTVWLGKWKKLGTKR